MFGTAADALFHILSVNPSCTKAFDSLVAPAGQETGLAQALAATDTADTAEHDGRQPPNFWRIAHEALLHLKHYEWEAILELKDRPSGRLDVEQHLNLRASCIHPFMRLYKCRECDRQLCSVCRTYDGKCYNTDFCRQVPSPWGAAIRVLEDSDHQIFQKWLEAARLLNACAEHIGWRSLPRLNHKPEDTHAKPNHTNTLAKSKRSLYCNRTDARACKPASQSAVPKSQAEHTYPFQVRCIRGLKAPHSPQLHRCRHRGVQAPTCQQNPFG